MGKDIWAEVRGPAEAMRQRTWIDRLDELAREHPGAPALVVAGKDGETFTWHDLTGRSAGLAWLFAARGVGKGSVVCIQLPNGAAFVLSALAAWRLGASVFPMRRDLPASERDALVALARPVVIVAEEAYESRGLSAAEVLAAPPLDPSELAPPPVASPAWMIASGGSTGSPKLIAPDVNTALAEGGVGFTGGRSHFADNSGHCHPTHLVCAPLYHTHGFTLLFRTLVEDFRVILMPRFDAGEFLDIVERERVAFFALVPTMVIRLLRSPMIGKRDFSSVETAILGAGATPEWAIRRWIEVIGGDRLLMGYGMSESIAAAFIRGSEWLEHPGSVGKPVGVETLVADDEGKPVPAGEWGELFFRPLQGEHRFRYVGEARSRTLPGGWVSVGDIGRLDGDGYLYILDRRADMVVTGGANVFVSEVEAALLAHPDVADVAVVGLSDPEWGRRVHAIVQPVAGKAPDPAALRDHCKQLLAASKAPRSFDFVDDLGRNEAGKLNRQALAAAREERG